MIQVICFSRQRPLQLHGYLTSLFKHWKGEFRVSVLMKVDPGYEAAYLEIAKEFTYVTFWGEDNFQEDLDTLIGDAELTCFGCDDVVYVAPVDTREVTAGLRISPYTLGWSLRLGTNITRDMFGNPLPQPELDAYWPEWHFTEGVGDWGYPWEVLGTVYRTSFVKKMVAAIQPDSPSQLEERGSRLWPQHTDVRHMCAYPTSRLVVPTVNIVQHEFPNGITGDPKYTPEYLLDQWNAGWRMDVDAYTGMTPESWRIGDFHMRRVAVAV